MPSQPSLQAWANTVAPSPSICSTRWISAGSSAAASQFLPLHAGRNPLQSTPSASTGPRGRSCLVIRGNAHTAPIQKPACFLKSKFAHPACDNPGDPDPAGTGKARPGQRSCDRQATAAASRIPRGKSQDARLVCQSPRVLPHRVGRPPYSRNTTTVALLTLCARPVLREPPAHCTAGIPQSRDQSTGLAEG
jgi:hypothetical protein